MGARNVRFSDADRKHVGRFLQHAVGRGKLSLAEFTERMNAASSTRMRGGLRAITFDGPGMRAVEYSSHARSLFEVPAAGFDKAEFDATLISSRLSTVSRQGSWLVPRKILVDSRMSSVTIDFRHAVMSSQVVDVVIDSYASAITLVIPAASSVDLNGVHAVASATNTVRTGSSLGLLHLFVHGRIRFGSLTVRYR